MSNEDRKILKKVIPVIVILLVICALFLFGRQFWYAFANVEPEEMGVQLESSHISAVVGPGRYSDFGMFVDLIPISVKQLPFSVEDPEIITKDKQRLGLHIDGDIFRSSDPERIKNLWQSYRLILTDDEAALKRVNAFALQSMKVCVGDKTFDDSVIGTARDELRSCIDDELSRLADNVGLVIDNVTVSNVILSPEVQASLDAIVQSRLETEKAAQDKLRADAQADAEQARQQGEIRVEQSRVQETTRQQTTLAKLEQEKAEAQKAVIEAQKSNELLSAERDKEIWKAELEVRTLKAKADQANEIVLAELYGKDGLVNLRIAQENRGAFGNVDKLFFVPNGTIPNLVLPGPSVTTITPSSAPQN